MSDTDLGPMWDAFMALRKEGMLDDVVVYPDETGKRWTAGEMEKAPYEVRRKYVASVNTFVLAQFHRKNKTMTLKPIRPITRWDDNSTLEGHGIFTFYDCQRIVKVLAGNGFACSLGLAYYLWNEHSTDRDALWLKMPKNDDELFDELKLLFEEVDR